MLAPFNPFGVKICGITNAEQGEAIAALQPNALGLNFWPKSKRYIAPAAAKAWAPALRSEHTALIAVTVNPSLAALREVIEADLADLVQLHGDEDPRRVGRIMELGTPVIKALQVRDRESLKAIAGYPCELILLDAWCPGLYGGEGKTFPWALAIEAIETFPNKRFILAGGLTPENVGEAVREVRPVGVDVASGVESSPGIKDLAKVAQFIENARAFI